MKVVNSINDPNPEDEVVTVVLTRQDVAILRSMANIAYYNKIRGELIARTKVPDSIKKSLTMEQFSVMYKTLCTLAREFVDIA